ncbi:unnamed protein product [Prunus armeniaca]
MASFSILCLLLRLCFLNCFGFHVSMAQNATTDPSEGASHLSKYSDGVDLNIQAMRHASPAYHWMRAMLWICHQWKRV